MLGVRLFGLLPYLLPCIGALYALVAIALARHGSPRAVCGVWILGPLVLTIALAGWVAFMLTPGIIPFHRWLHSFALVLAAPTAAAGLAATLLAATRMARRWLALHVLATLVVLAIAFWLGAVASMHVVELIETIQ